ncbi:hypothetical protein MAR_021389 [Mya arenaria]|uniref:Uncharacterized protein n=1 Tax=Mya arenaria TaxID=6604 RepID=A0ABY7E7K3_MYAAR|nr:hypothetical protein MAR_021389 [Mya arenaria]
MSYQILEAKLLMMTQMFLKKNLAQREQ